MGAPLGVQLYGYRRGERDYWEEVDGIRYDNMFIFDELGWNFEPSELGAAFGLQQLKKLSKNHARRRTNFTMYTEFLRAHETASSLPRQLEGLDTAWLCYPVTIRPDAGFTRSDLQRYLDDHDVDTRTIWTGNAVRQPMMKGVDFRAPVGWHAAMPIWSWKAGSSCPAATPWATRASTTCASRSKGSWPSPADDRPWRPLSSKPSVPISPLSG